MLDNKDLRIRAMELACELHRTDPSVDVVKKAREIEGYLVGEASPIPAAEFRTIDAACRVPANFRHSHSWHWIRYERTGSPSVAEWMNGMWYCTDRIGGLSPEELYRRGWEYWKPVEEPGDPLGN